MQASGSERVALSRELSEFLVELSIALHRHSMYPTGHPSLGPAVQSLVRRAERLLQDRASIALGVARRQLIIEGVATDPNQPVLRRLAEGLHRHHIGAISITRGVEPHEIDEAMHALAAEPNDQDSLGLRHRQAATRWPHLKLHPLTFDGLSLADDDPSAERDVDHQARSREAELWVGLARAALASDQTAGQDSVATEPDAVARAINEHPRAEAYDQVIVGYLLQIAGELKSASSDRAEELRRRTSRLIASLRPETLQRLLDMGGDVAKRGQFVIDATHGMAFDAVLEIVKAAAEASGQTISHGLVRMLTKLAAHAELGSDLARPRANRELREQVGDLLQDWHLEDPNPEAYRAVLQRLATSAPAETGSAAAEAGARPEPLRVVQMSLESGAFGPLAEAAIDELVDGGHLNAVIALLESPPAGAWPVAEAVRARVTSPETLRTILAGERVDFASLEHLLAGLPRDAYGPLLDAVGSSPKRSIRARLLEQLTKIEVDISPLVVARLEDERWYVQRNMLILLERSGRVPEGFSARPWTEHPDPRVRIEAIRLQLSLPHERDDGIRAAVADDNPRVIRLGLAALQQGCPQHLVDRVAELAASPQAGDEIRLLAVTALGQLREPSALGVLLRLADGGRSLLGRPRLSPKSPVLIAALHALARNWPADPRAAGPLRAAERSSDPELRDAVSCRVAG